MPGIVGRVKLQRPTRSLKKHGGREQGGRRGGQRLGSSLLPCGQGAHGTQAWEGGRGPRSGGSGAAGRTAFSGPARSGWLHARGPSKHSSGGRIMETRFLPVRKGRYKSAKASAGLNPRLSAWSPRWRGERAVFERHGCVNARGHACIRVPRPSTERVRKQ